MASSSRSIVAAVLAAGAFAAGCAGDAFKGNAVHAEDISGDYTVALTNGENTCMNVTMMDSTWMDGAMTTGIAFTIHQDGSKIWADVEGVSAIAFVVLTGETRFQGDVNDFDFTLTNFGSKVYMQEGCTYKVNAVIDGTLEGDSIQGTLTYVPAFEDEDACAPYACQAVQAFSASRPPKA